MPHSVCFFFSDAEVRLRHRLSVPLERLLILSLFLGAVPVVARAQCQDGTAPPCQAVSSRDRAPNGVAVLPFSARDTADRDLAQDLSESVTARLGGVPGVQVTPSSLVRTLQRSSGDDRSRIADSLGVRFIVDGDVKRVGTRVQLLVEAMDAQSNSQVFASTYMSAPDSLQALAALVVREVAHRIAPEVATPRPTSQKIWSLAAILCNAVGTLAMIVIFAWGVFILVVAKFDARGIQLRGPTARVAGLFLVLQLPLALFINFLLRGALNHGDQFAREVYRNLAWGIVCGLSAVASVVGARMYARGNVPAIGSADAPERS